MRDPMASEAEGGAGDKVLSWLCSDGNRRSFGDLAGLEGRPNVPPVKTDPGKGKMAFSNPQPTAFPSHTMNVSQNCLSCSSSPLSLLKNTHCLRIYSHVLGTSQDTHQLRVDVNLNWHPLVSLRALAMLCASDNLRMRVHARCSPISGCSPKCGFNSRRAALWSSGWMGRAAGWRAISQIGPQAVTCRITGSAGSLVSTLFPCSPLQSTQPLILHGLLCPLSLTSAGRSTMGG